MSLMGRKELFHVGYWAMFIKAKKVVANIRLPPWPQHLTPAFRVTPSKTRAKRHGHADTPSACSEQLCGRKRVLKSTRRTKGHGKNKPTSSYNNESETRNIIFWFSLTGEKTVTHQKVHQSALCFRRRRVLCRQKSREALSVQQAEITPTWLGCTPYVSA